MILADKIIELRKKNGWSQEDLAEQLEVSRQSVSKWESAQSVPDMNRILKMSDLFGVTTDFLLKDDMEMPERNPEPEVDRNLKTVSMEEAQEFLVYKKKAARNVSLGVMLCILSPVPVTILAILMEMRILPIAEAAVAGIGASLLFLMVGAAVALFITTGISGRRFEFFEKEYIDTEYGVDGMVRDRKEKFRHSYTVMLVSGIVLCVISVIPVLALAAAFGEDSLVPGIGGGILLVFVAVGVMLIVRASVTWGAFQMILQEGDYTREEKAENKKNENISSLYWCSVTAGYLALSFLTGAWHRTWIIWPIAGVSYGVVTAILKTIRARN